MTSASSASEKTVLPVTLMSRTNTRMLPNPLPGGSCSVDGISGRVGLGGGVSGALNSSLNGAGGFPDRPVGSKMGGIGGSTWARTEAFEERGPTKRLMQRENP